MSVAVHVAGAPRQGFDRLRHLAFDPVRHLGQGAAAVAIRLIALAVAFRPQLFVLVRLGAEDFQGAAHGADLVPAAQSRDLDIQGAPAHGAHGGGHVLQRADDAAPDHQGDRGAQHDADHPKDDHE